MKTKNEITNNSKPMAYDTLLCAFKNANMENYWKKENPEYEELERRIEDKQDKINSGIITNGKTLRYAKRDIKRWKEALLNTAKYLD